MTAPPNMCGRGPYWSRCADLLNAVHPYSVFCPRPQPDQIFHSPTLPLCEDFFTARHTARSGEAIVAESTLIE